MAQTGGTNGWEGGTPPCVGFIGAGNMAKAICSGILNSALLMPDRILVSAPSNRNFGFWTERGIQTTNDNVNVLNSADIIFIAVKPQYFDGMVSSLKGWKGASGVHKCFVTLMVGKQSFTVKKKLSEVINTSLEIIKVMPNTAALVGAGCSVITHDGTKGRQFENVMRIMKSTGRCEEIPETMMNACGALSGSGPAYLYMVIEALADGGVKKGIPRDLAYKLAAQTMIGAGQMVLESGKHPGTLKDEVCSPGGTTITAVHQLEKAGIRAAFMNAVEAAFEKSELLG